MLPKNPFTGISSKAYGPLLSQFQQETDRLKSRGDYSGAQYESLMRSQDRLRQLEAANPQGRGMQSGGIVESSFNRMNIGQVGGLGGRMGELEKASMRLAEAASQRRMGEAAQESQLKGSLLEKQASIDKKREKENLESQLRALQASKPIGGDGTERIQAWQQEVDKLKSQLSGM